jgi:hypothetical protein
MHGRKGWRLPALALAMATALGFAVISSAEQGLRSGMTVTDPPVDFPYLDVVHGVQLPPEAIGESYTEDMATALAREQANPPPRQGRDTEHIGRDGLWVVPSRGATFFPRSGEHYVTNKWGDTRMGIAFPSPVTVKGTYVAGQAADGVWTSGLRVIGYRAGREVGRTDWFEDLGQEPAWFDIGLFDVDRIVFEAKPVFRGAGWYALDDFTYMTIDKAGEPKSVVLDFEDCGYRQTLTGTDYAGLTWETGTGDPGPGIAIHPPVVPPGYEKDPFESERQPPAAPLRGEGTLPDFYNSFKGAQMGDHNQYYFPPDSHGAVSPDYYCEIVNCNFVVYNKSNGAALLHLTLGSFMPGAQGDPRIIYDHSCQRWFAVATDWTSRVYFAMSYTDNPLGAWFKTNILVSQDEDQGHWPDFPTLGVNADGIFTAMLMVGGSNTMSVFAIDKAPLLESPPQMGTVTAFRGLIFEGAIQPAFTYGDPGREYFLSTHTNTELRMRMLLGDMTNPSMYTVAYPAVPSFANPPNAPALGSATDIDTGDTRLQRVVYRDGYLWTAHTIGVSGRCAARWYKVDTSTGDVEAGTVADSSLHYYYPSIMVNAAGDAAMGFSGSDANQYAGCYYTGRHHTDAPGEMADPVQYKAGLGPWNNLDGFGRNRWGDYSHTVLDPSDEMTFFTIQEFGYTGNKWCTYIAEIGYSAVPDNDTCAAAIIVEDGVTAFSNVGALTDGPDEPDLCNYNGYTHVEADIWYRYNAPCTGDVTIDLCNCNYDTKVAIYAGGCPGGPNEAIACDDNSCGDEGSIVTFPAEQSNWYWIRIGGYQGDTGTGLMFVSCEPSEDCPADFDNDGDVDTADLLYLLAAWGTPDGDVDNDGDTDTADLLALLADWGPC